MDQKTREKRENRCGRKHRVGMNVEGSTLNRKQHRADDKREQPKTHEDLARRTPLPFFDILIHKDGNNHGRTGYIFRPGQNLTKPAHEL